MISLLAAAGGLSPKLSLSPFMISLLAAAALSFFILSPLAAAAALSPKLVFLRDFALGCRCRLVIFLLGFDVDAVL